MPKHLDKIIRIKEFEKVRIIQELLPDRCEICHQNDYFNPETNYCTRCRNLNELIKLKSENESMKLRLNALENK